MSESLIYTLNKSRGEIAAEGQFPYQVSLREDGKHICGGSILDATTILSAAHCVEGSSPSSLTVAVGINKLNDKSAVVYDVKSIVVHADYDTWVLQNDICIIKLKKPIQFNAKVQPVKLRQTPIRGGENCTVSGWSAAFINGPVHNDLHFIRTKTSLSEQERNNKLLEGNFVDVKELRVVANVFASQVSTLPCRGEGICFGDSGGPLVDSNGEQIGIVSWSNGCAEGNPDFFTRVTSFLDWIEKNR